LDSQRFVQRLLAIVFGIIALGVLALIGLSFIKLDSRPTVQSKVISFPIDEVWKSVYQKENYLKSKKEIVRYTIYDSIRPQWVEYYSPNDSVENRTLSYEKNHLLRYLISNKKYEQTHEITIRLDSLAPQKTAIKVTEKSAYINNWSNIYFRLFHKDAVAQFEILKIENTLQYIQRQKNNPA